MSGIINTVKDTFFGGAEKDAARAQTQALEQSQLFTREGVEQARTDVNALFPAAMQNARQGSQAALDIFGQSAPAQIDAFRGGNVAAQNQILAGMPQFQNAILGNQVDFSQFQPFEGTQQDLGFLQQQLPQSSDPFAPPAQLPQNIQDLIATGDTTGQTGFETRPQAQTGLGTVPQAQNPFGANPLGGSFNFDRFNLGGRF